MVLTVIVKGLHTQDGQFCSARSRLTERQRVQTPINMMERRQDFDAGCQL